MKKLVIIVMCLLVSFSAFAQEKREESAPILNYLKNADWKKWENYNYDPVDWKDFDFYAHEPYIVWGTNTDEEDELYMNEMIADLVKFRMQKWLNQKGKLGEVIKDTELTPEIMENNNLVLVGHPNSNHILQAIQDKLPIQILDKETIQVGPKQFKGDEIGTIFFYPNPLNPERMIYVVAAPSYESLRFIPYDSSYMVYELKDYNPKTDRLMELAMGDYDENGKIEEVDMVDNELVDTGENDPIELGELDHYDPPEWAKNGVMYEIFVRSFYDSDGDGVGDLKGITQKLDYLNDGDDSTTDDLDIEVIWLMPIFDSPSYHCYDVRDYMKINSDYGTNEDFQELLQEAHKRGIRIVTDLILNHCSNQHEFFQDAYDNPDSKYDEWFYFSNASNTRAHNWYFRHGDEDRNMLNPYMPAWNVNNPDVQEYLFDVAKYWMDPNGDGDFSDGIDGFRCDYAIGPSHEFWKLFRQEVKAVNPDVLLLAEAWADMNKIAMFFDNQFDMAFDFPFQGSLTGTISSGSAREFNNVMASYDILPSYALMNRFLNNHDMNRIYNRMTVKKAKLGATMLLTIPQMPMIYYGDEIGMKGEKNPYDEGIRRPFEWCKANDCEGMTNWYPVWNETPDGISVEEQLNKDDSILEYFKDLLTIREEYPTLETGDIRLINIMADGEHYRRAVAYTVTDEVNKMLVVVNLHDPIDLTLDLSHLKDVKTATLTDVLKAKPIKTEILSEDNKAEFPIHCEGETAYIFVLE